MKMTFHHTILALIGIGSLALAPALSAAVIYSDDFSGGAAAPLNGTTPDTTSGSFGGTSGATWSADGFYRADGSVLAINGGSGSHFSGWLPFTPQAGNIYTISADVNTTGGSADWIGFGFAQNNNTAEGLHTLDNGFDWALLRNTRGVNQGSDFYGPATSNTAGNYNSPTGVVALSQVLDTTGALWTETFLVNGTVVNGPGNSGTNPTIHYVGFSHINTASGTIDNFSLTAGPVPEPGTASLLGVALVGIAAVRRRRATAV